MGIAQLLATGVCVAGTPATTKAEKQAQAAQVEEGDEPRWVGFAGRAVAYQVDPAGDIVKILCRGLYNRCYLVFPGPGGYWVKVSPQESTQEALEFFTNGDVSIEEGEGESVVTFHGVMDNN